MDSNRTNLDESKNNSSFLILGIIFIILSVLGVVLLFQILKSNAYPGTAVGLSSQTAPTSALQSETPAPQPSESISLTPVPSGQKLSPTLKASPSPKPSPTLKPTAALTPTEAETADLTPTPAFQTFSDEEKTFSVTYASSRKVYEDAESGGKRYTFYAPQGNFAIHVNTKWVWQHPDRKFTSDFTIGGLSTFRYDISSQTIVDVQKDNTYYTIQCIHNGKTELKTECEEFIKSFKLPNS